LLLTYRANEGTNGPPNLVDLYDLETGATERIGEGLRPAAIFGWMHPERWYRLEPTGQLLFRKDRHTLVRWDPNTGELVPVIVAAGGV
ncbi:MAG: hypothetical protein P8127_17355, partial [Acidobacteriota bacterium]